MAKKASRPLDIAIIAVLMVLFGLAEIATGFTHSFLGILSTANAALSTYGAVAIGAIYAIGGLLLLTMRKREAQLAMGCLVIVIVGRIFLVLTGLYPLNPPIQALAIFVGTALAVIFAIYIRLKWNKFR